MVCIATMWSPTLLRFLDHTGFALIGFFMTFRPILKSCLWFIAEKMCRIPIAGFFLSCPGVIPIGPMSTRAGTRSRCILGIL